MTASDPPPRRRTALATVVVLIALGALFHLPRLDRPFGIADINAGTYFGLFVKTYEDLGFMAVRGLPLGPQRLPASGAGALPYLNHPPGMAWLYAALGSAEWKFRAPTAVAAVLAAIALFFLLHGVVGPLAAALASIGLLGLPSATIYSQASYETMVLAHGLWLWLATLRSATLRIGSTTATAGGARTAWRAVQVVVSFTGPWADWSYVFFCLGLVPLVAARPLGAWIRRLAVPAVVTGLSAALIVLWRVWAAQCPLLDFPPVDTSLAEMLRTTIFERPPLADYLRLGARTMIAATTLPFALVALLGLVVLWQRSRNLAVALLLAGLGQPLVFGNHATDHVHFYCYTGASMVACAAGIAALRDRRLRVAGCVLLALLAAHAWWKSAGVVQHSDTTFLRDLGRVLTEATANPGPTGSARKPMRVASNFPLVYPYYCDSPHVGVGPLTIIDPVLTVTRRNPQFCYGYRYLWFKDATGASADHFLTPTRTALAQFFEPFPRRRVPELERQLHEPGFRFDFDIREVWLVDVPPAFRVGIAHRAEDAARAGAIARALTDDGLEIRFEHAEAVPVPRLPAALAGSLQHLTHLVVLDGASLQDGHPDAAVLRPVAQALLDRGLFVTVVGGPGAQPLPAHRVLDSAVPASPAAPDVARAVVESFVRIAVREDTVPVARPPTRR